MPSNIATEMRIMQDNLCELRKIAGWTAETLAGKLGVTKQTVSNLETQKVSISRIQYIAIRVILECEIAANQENATLRKVMSVLFDVLPDRYDVHKETLRTAMISIASIAAAGLGDLQLYSGAIALLAPLGHITSQTVPFPGGEPSLRWMMNHLTEETKDEKRRIDNENR